MKISVKIYKQGDDVLLAACDEDLLGKVYREGEVCLSVKNSFYRGETIECKGLGNKLELCTIANLVGQSTVEAAIEEGFGEWEDVMKVQGIPHLQIVRM